MTLLIINKLLYDDNLVCINLHNNIQDDSFRVFIALPNYYN